MRSSQINDTGELIKNSIDFDRVCTQVAQYRQRAVQGDADAMCWLAYHLKNGLGVPKNRSESELWWNRAASHGHPTAKGLCLHYGYGVVEDKKAAIEWYGKAAGEGHAIAQNGMAYCLREGIGVEQDQKAAFEFYRKAAAQGHAVAQCNLGACYEFAEGVAKDEKLAIEWYRKAADQGLGDAQFNLAACYKEGFGVPKDLSIAAEWFAKAAKQGDAEAESLLDGVLIRLHGSTMASFKVHLIAIRSWVANCCCLLGRAHGNGSNTGGSGRIQGGPASVIEQVRLATIAAAF